MMGGFGGGGVLLGGLLMLVFWALIIGGAVWLVVWLMRGGQGSSLIASQRETPLDILKARYAKGEITKEQFEQMKHDLG